MQNLDLELVARNALKPHMGKQILDEVRFLNLPPSNSFTGMGGEKPLSCIDVLTGQIWQAGGDPDPIKTGRIYA